MVDYCYEKYIGKYNYTQKSRFNDLLNYCELKNGEIISGEYVNRDSRFVVRCAIGHVWNASFKSLVTEQHWCPVCGNSLRMSLNNPGCRDEVKRKIKDTWNKKYGGHPIFDKIISDKQIKKVNRIFILKHWFSQEEILCKGTWEKQVVEWLNRNKIDYNFHPQCFYVNENSRYTPDLYLPDRDLWVEIKGYFRKDAEEKWNWFHKEYPNSELWDKKKLKEMGIL